MRLTKKIATWFTAIMLVLFMTTASATDEKNVDWGTGVIRVKGYGVGKAVYKDTSPGQYRLMGIQAARMDAQRKLVECIDGIQVTFEAKMSDFSAEYVTVKTRAAGLVKNAVEVGDPKYNNEMGAWEVTMEMKLFGGAKSVASVAFLPFKDEPKVDFPPPVNKEVVNQPTVVSQNYTGLIVDCSGLGEINPVMSPVIKNTDGTKIYGHENLDPDKIIHNGMASYAESVDDEISRSRAGSKPLIVKATKLTDLDATPVVSIDDADKILAANQSDKFLNNCAVVFVK